MNKMKVYNINNIRIYFNNILIIIYKMGKYLLLFLMI